MDTMKDTIARLDKSMGGQTALLPMQDKEESVTDMKKLLQLSYSSSFE